MDSARDLAAIAEEHGLFPDIFALSTEAGRLTSFSRRVLARYTEAPVGEHIIRRRSSGSSSLYYLEPLA